MSKTPEELLAERSKRLEDAYALRKPDRTPISLNLGYMLAKMGGITCQELDADPEKAQQLLEKAAVYFQPDQAVGLGAFVSAPSVLLGDRLSKWPGYGLPPDKPMQFIEGEYMKAEEYDEFLDDPSNYTLRKLLPRMYEKLDGLALAAAHPHAGDGLSLLCEPGGAEPSARDGFAGSAGEGGALPPRESSAGEETCGAHGGAGVPDRDWPLGGVCAGAV